MEDTITIGELSIHLTRKNVKHAHLSVHPPNGEITLVAPEATRVEVARAYAISKLGWIREQRRAFDQQAREAPREYVERESHYLWGRRYLLGIEQASGRSHVRLDHKRITLVVKPGSDAAAREDVMRKWQRGLLHEVVPVLIRRWEPRLEVSVSRYYLQRMKTRWGSCNHQARHIRLNTELVKKPKDWLEYVVVHEMAHLLEPDHGERFVALLDRHRPAWRESRAELNELPLVSEV